MSLVGKRIGFHGRGAPHSTIYGQHDLTSVTTRTSATA
jgi:hypothetical protein